MPYDNVPDDKQGEMERCVQQVMSDGKDKEAAIAICYTSVMGKSTVTSDTKTIRGDTVKSLGNGRYGGYLVRFSTANDPDLTGEYFDASTYFGDAEKSTVWFNHRQPVTAGGRTAKAIESPIGMATLKRDDVGVWAETVLEARNEYERYVKELADAGKLGWSSGTAAHLVDYEPAGKATHIKTWVLGLDASLTPTPAEPRNAVAPLKSVDGEPEPIAPDAGDGEIIDAVNAMNEAIQKLNAALAAKKPEEDTPPETIEQETSEMDESQIKSLVEQAAKSAVEEYRKSEPANVTAGGANVQVITDAGDQPFKNDGEFFMAVKSAAYNPRDEDVRLRKFKATGLNEAIPSEGGYLLQSQTNGGIIERMYKGGQLLSRVSTDNIGPNSNGMTYNAINETSRVNGSRWGGVYGYWLAEAGTKTASKPAFRQMELKLKKVAALAYATDELLQDATALDSWINRTVPEELRFRVEDAFYNGDGVGKPLGIMNSPCLVTVTRDTASAVKYADIVTMWSRRWAGVNDYVWLVNQDVMPQLDSLALTVGSSVVPPNFVTYSPEGVMKIKGRDVIEIEQCASLNTTGDIMLASLSQYQAIQKGGVQSASSIHVAFTTDETAFRFVYRVDGQPIWNSALTPFKGSNTQSPFVVLGSASA